MPWTKQQKALVHIYADAAKMPDQAYRAILHDVADAGSAAAPWLTQYHFDQVMARVEARLEYAIAEAFVPRPAAGRIRDLGYWRRRLPGPADTNSRQIHVIDVLWHQLRQRLPEPDRTDDYLCRIASRACGVRISSRHGLRAWQAGLLIDALKDRLSYAIREKILG